VFVIQFHIPVTVLGQERRLLPCRGKEPCDVVDFLLLLLIIEHFVFILRSPERSMTFPVLFTDDTVDTVHRCFTQAGYRLPSYWVLHPMWDVEL